MPSVARDEKKEATMSAKPPPVPPQNQSPKGTGDPNVPPVDDSVHGRTSPLKPDQQGQSANTKVNTTHQGYQQDR